MSRLQQAVAVLILLAVCAVVGAVLLGHSSAVSRTLPAVQGPELSDESLKAQMVVTGMRPERTEVKISGSMRHQVVDEVVFRSQESPNMLRMGWESADHLVISVPQYPQDAGKAVGAGDPAFLCGAEAGSTVRVTCDAYPVGPR